MTYGNPYTMSHMARKKGNVTSINVLNDVHAAIDAYCIQHDRKLGATVDRLIAWFLRQDDVVKIAVLSDVPDKLQDATRVVLCTLAAEVGGCDEGGNPGKGSAAEIERGRVTRHSPSAASPSSAGRAKRVRQS